MTKLEREQWEHRLMESRTDVAASYALLEVMRLRAQEARLVVNLGLGEDEGLLTASLQHRLKLLLALSARTETAAKEVIAQDASVIHVIGIDTVPLK